MTPVLPLAASAREEVAGFLGALLFVYVLILIAYIVTSLVFALGVRMPYSRWFNAVMDFLRDLSEPYLRPWRKIIPMIGPLDLSPMVAIFALQIVGGILVGLIRG